MSIKRIGILTSGGDAPGMNAAIRGAVRQAAALGIETYGIYRGYQGLVDQEWRPLTPRHCSNIILRGGTILNTARCQSWKVKAVRAEAAREIKAAGIDGLVVIGGDGSFTGANLLFEEHGIPMVGIPGTIDNDLPGTDRTLGFDTALNTAVEAIDKIRDTAQAHDRVFLVEVMGHATGMLAVNTALACGAEGVIYPEAGDGGYESLVRELRLGWEHGKRSSIVVVAEGDEVNNAYAIGEKLRETHKLDLRVVVLGHVQRGGSPTALDRIWGSRWGSEAVKRLAAGESGIYLGAQGDDLISIPLKRILDPRPTPSSELASLVKVLAR